MDQTVRFIEAYVHKGRIGVLVELALETLFTSEMPEFKRVARDLAVQIASAPVADVEALMVQAFFRDASAQVGHVLSELSDRLGEHISITRFVRWDAAAATADFPEPPPAIAAEMGTSEV